MKEVRIYDRWGGLIREWRNIQGVFQWDGMYQGQIAPDGVYVYQITYRLRNGEEMAIHGTLTVVK